MGNWVSLGGYLLAYSNSCRTEAAVDVQNAIVCISIGREEHCRICDLGWGSESFQGYGVQRLSVGILGHCYLVMFVSGFIACWCEFLSG